MKKQVKLIIFGTLSLLILTYLIFIIIDYTRFKNKKLPLIVFKTNIDLYEDGRVQESYSLGYVVRIYDRERINENEFTFSLSPQKYKNVSVGTVNDIANAIYNKDLKKNNFIKMYGKYNKDSKSSMQTFSYSAHVTDNLQTEAKLTFDNKMIFNCKNSIELDLEHGDNYILEGQIKKIKKSKDKITVELSYCYKTDY